jgi:ribonuclease VapC
MGGLIVVDASALVSIAVGEPDAGELREALARADRIVAAPINLLETGIVLAKRGHEPNAAAINAWIRVLRVEEHQGVTAAEAMAACFRFGRGFHPAKLNIADCFAYALAKQLDAPLLYKGDDFALTDIRSALQPT